MERRWLTGVLGLWCVLAVAGCGGGPADVPADSSAKTSRNHADEHPTHGPHEGDLVELGDEEYHAEVVHEANGRLSVYLLDGAAQNAVPIEATEIVLNVTHDGEAEQFTLAAAPAESDPAGTSSRFVASDGHAGEDLDHAGTQAKLVVTIGGVSYQGAIAHDHDHDHAQGDHDHADGGHEH